MCVEYTRLQMEYLITFIKIQRIMVQLITIYFSLRFMIQRLMSDRKFDIFLSSNCCNTVYFSIFSFLFMVQNRIRTINCTP